MKFEGKVAAVTGASVGIGRAVAMQFAENGADLVLIDTNGEKLNVLAEELAAKHQVRVKTYVCDVSDEQAVTSALNDGIESLGKIDILVNNAALWRSHKSFLETSVDDWKRYMDINVMGTVY